MAGPVLKACKSCSFVSEDDVCPRCGRREFEAVSVEKLKQLGVYKNLNADTLGYHGDPAEERERAANPVE